MIDPESLVATFTGTGGSRPRGHTDGHIGVCPCFGVCVVPEHQTGNLESERTLDDARTEEVLKTGSIMMARLPYIGFRNVEEAEFVACEALLKWRSNMLAPPTPLSGQQAHTDFCFNQSR